MLLPHLRCVSSAAIFRRLLPSMRTSMPRFMIFSTRPTVMTLFGYSYLGIAVFVACLSAARIAALNSDGPHIRRFPNKLLMNEVFTTAPFSYVTGAPIGRQVQSIPCAPNSVRCGTNRKNEIPCLWQKTRDARNDRKGRIVHHHAIRGIIEMFVIAAGPKGANDRTAADGRIPAQPFRHGFIYRRGSKTVVRRQLRLKLFDETFVIGMCRLPRPPPSCGYFNVVIRREKVHNVRLVFRK